MQSAAYQQQIACFLLHFVFLLDIIETEVSKMTAISIRLEDKDKQALDEMCAEMGMSVSTFFTIYAKRALRERRIPFEINAPLDPFYSESNRKALQASEAELRQGKVITKTLEELEALADA